MKAHQLLEISLQNRSVQEVNEAIDHLMTRIINVSCFYEI